MANISSEVGESVAVRELDDVNNCEQKRLDTTFHPLAVLQHEFLSRDDGLKLPQHGNNRAVLVNDTIYVGDCADSRRILSYSLTERSWDTNLSIPDEAAGYCELAVCESNKLVLVGWQKKYRPYKLWVRQGDEWNADIPPPPLVMGRDMILSAAGIEHFLLVLHQSSLHIGGSKLVTNLTCYDMITRQWKEQCKGPVNEEMGTIKLLFHNRQLYALKHSFSYKYMCNETKTTLFKACVSITGDVMTIDDRWIPLKVVSDDSIPKLAIIENRLIIAAHVGRKVKNFTQSNSDNKKTTFMDIDEFDVEFCQPPCAIFGLPDGSLVAIGDVVDPTCHTSSTAVIQFKSIMQPYDCNQHFTMEALRRLEKTANIPLLTVKAVKQKLSGIKTYAGFKVQTYEYVDTFTSVFLQYMHSWLSAYKNRQCTTEPTWKNFLDALRSVKLTELAEQINDCLKSASAIVETEAKEASTGIEEIHKLQVQLKSLHEQLQLNSEETVILQKFRTGVDASYKLCFTMAHKIQHEQSALRSDNKKLTKERDQLLDEVACLRVELAKKDEHPPAKHQCTNEASVVSAAVSVKPILKQLLRELRAKAADWEEIGIELEVDDGALKQIKADNPGDSKSCLRELCRKWLSRVDPQPKWVDIVEAIEGIGDEELATKIKENYCRIP